MAQKPFNTNAAIRSAIRRVFSRSPVVRETMMKVRREVAKFNKNGSRAKKDAVQYQCNVCAIWTKSTAISVDHIEPVIDIKDGFVDWNEFVERLFCDAGNLQVICDPCHNKKTNEERFKRIYSSELNSLNSLTSSTCVPDEVAKKFVKKFTKARLAKFPYPNDFKDRINAIRRSIGLKV